MLSPLENFSTTPTGSMSASPRTPRRTSRPMKPLPETITRMLAIAIPQSIELTAIGYQLSVGARGQNNTPARLNRGIEALVGVVYILATQVKQPARSVDAAPCR